MPIKLRSLGHALFIASLLLVFTQRAHSEVGSTPKKEEEFFLSGSAYQEKDGTITVNIVNNATDGSVYLISQGEIDSCATTIKTARRRQLKLPSWEGGFLG